MADAEQLVIGVEEIRDRLHLEAELASIAVHGHPWRSLA